MHSDSSKSPSGKSSGIDYRVGRLPAPFYRLSFNVEVSWPRYYLDFLDVFDFVNLNFIPFQSLSCVSPFDYFSKLLTVTLVPIGVR